MHFILPTLTLPGISAEQREHLFERYAKGQQMGTGLGLYIAKRIVDAHGAMLSVDSVDGRGSKFSFSLPIVDES